jgi:hypothetical protein
VRTEKERPARSSVATCTCLERRAVKSADRITGHWLFFPRVQWCSPHDASSGLTSSLLGTHMRLLPAAVFRISRCDWLLNWVNSQATGGHDAEQVPYISTPLRTRLRARANYAAQLISEPPRAPDVAGPRPAQKSTNKQNCGGQDLDRHLSMLDHMRRDYPVWSRSPKFATIHLLSTVKASNFGRHGNFASFLSRFAASLGELRTKNERNWVCKYTFFFL